MSICKKTDRRHSWWQLWVKDQALPWQTCVVLSGNKTICWRSVQNYFNPPAGYGMRRLARSQPVCEVLDPKEFWVLKFTVPSWTTHILAFKGYSTQLKWKSWEKRRVYILRKVNLMFIKKVMDLRKKGNAIHFCMLLNHIKVYNLGASVKISNTATYIFVWEYCYPRDYVWGYIEHSKLNIKHE